MKVEVDITKSKFFAIFGALLFIAGLIAVTAFNSGGTGGNPSNFGHSVDELDWSKNIPSNVWITGNLNSTGLLRGSSLCIGTDCKTAWNQVSSTVTLQTTIVTCSYSGSISGTSECSAVCPSGYTVLSGGCTTSNDGGTDLADSQPWGNGWRCNYGGDSGAGTPNLVINGSALCGRLA